MDSPVSITTDRWHSFLAEGAISLLAEDPDDSRIRVQVAGAVASYWYLTTAVVMLRAFNLRSVLGEEFQRLQNLAVLWAALRHMRVFSDFSALGGHGPRLWWHARLVRAYVMKKAPADPLDWAELGLRVHRYLKRRRRRASASDGPRGNLGGPGLDSADTEPNGGETEVQGGKMEVSLFEGFDLEVLRHAFIWLPLRLEEAVDQSERNEWNSVYRQLLAVAVGRFPKVVAQRVEISNRPAQFDYWLLERIGALIPQFSGEGERRCLWQPLFDLGPPAHRWITLFLDGWMQHGSAVADSPPTFVNLWKEMIVYALQSARWLASHEHFDYDLEDMWAHLMGVERSGSALTAKHAVEVGRLGVCFEEWSKRWLGYSRSLRLFATFIARPAGLELLPQGVLWVYAAVSRANKWVWRESGLEEGIVSALRACLRAHSASIAREGDLQTAFFGLLAVMTSRRNAEALQLRDEIASRPE